ncbi:hypothetical protein CHUAL_000088 [Chamberlinius hualienensis]
MAETVDLIRDYCKQFILRPINEQFEKNELNFNEKIEKLEKHFIQRIQQLDKLIQSNKQKLDTTIETLQANQNKLEGKIDFMQNSHEKTFWHNASHLFGKFEDMGKHLADIEKQMSESVKQIEIQLSENIKSIEKDWNKKFDKNTENVGQLQLEMRNKFEETENSLKEEAERCKTVEKKTKKTIETFSKDMKEKYDKCIQHNEIQIKTISEQNENNQTILKNDLSKTTEEIAELQSKVESTSKAIEKIHSDEIGQLIKFEAETKQKIDQLELKVETTSKAFDKIHSDEMGQFKKNEDETKKTIDTLSKDVKMKYDECIQHHEIQMKIISEQNENNQIILKNDLSKTMENIAQLHLEFQSASREIEEIKSDKITLLEELKKVQNEIKQTIETVSNDIKDKDNHCIQRHLKNKLRCKIITEKNETNERIFKNDLSKTTEDIAQLQSKVKEATEAIEEIKSDEIGQLKIIEDETKKTIDILSKDIKMKYEQCIQHHNHSEMQTKKLYEENENNQTILKNDLSKTIENIAQLHLEFQSASREIKEIKSGKIKPLEELKNVQNEIKQTIANVNNDIEEKYDQCIQRHLRNELQLKTISIQNETSERNFKNDLSKTINDIDQLQSKGEINVIEDRVKEINLNKEFDKVIN